MVRAFYLQAWFAFENHDDDVALRGDGVTPEGIPTRSRAYNLNASTAR
jgi:hypothetical protein